MKKDTDSPLIKPRLLHGIANPLNKASQWAKSILGPYTIQAKVSHKTMPRQPLGFSRPLSKERMLDRAT